LVVIWVREAVAKVSFTFTHDSSNNMLTFTFRISLPALPPRYIPIHRRTRELWYAMIEMIALELSDLVNHKLSSQDGVQTCLAEL
jgi:hypothetical protein